MEILQKVITSLTEAVEPLEKEIFFLFSFLPYPFNVPGFILPWLITIFFTILMYYLSRNITYECDSKRQAFLEIIYEALESVVKLAAGEKHVKELMPALSTVFIFVLSSNMMGVIPSLKSPTGFLVNCFGLALITVFLTIYYGIKAHGVKFIKIYTGEIWWMAPIMFPIHIVGELSHPISLTLRLFGNIWGEDVVIIVLTAVLCPLLLPLPMLLMSLFTSVLQALVFTILSGIYLSSALEGGH